LRRLVAVALIAWSAQARADDDFLHRLAGEARARLDAAVAARAPKLVPPVPLVPRWRAQRLGPIDLGADPVAVAAADLDGDGKAELYIVTAREVIAVSLAGRPRELGRVAFTGEPAVPEPRDTVGAAVVERGAVIASVSSFQRGMRVAWRGKVLVGEPGEPGFELCPGERAQLVPGRNYFGEGAAATFITRCAAAVDPQGYPLKLRAQLSTGSKLEVTVARCAADGSACADAAHYSYANVGTAFELADLDRDGAPELVYSAAVAPGDRDYVKVLTLGEDEKRARLRKPASAEGVVGLAVADVNGDGAPHVIAVVRLFAPDQPGHVELWRLD